MYAVHRGPGGPGAARHGHREGNSAQRGQADFPEDKAAPNLAQRINEAQVKDPGFDTSMWSPAWEVKRAEFPASIPLVGQE